MIESDYVFMKPLPIPDQAGQVRGAAGRAESLPVPVLCALACAAPACLAIKLPSFSPLFCPTFSSCHQAQYKAWGYPFDYIQPRSHTAAIRKLWPEGEPEDVQGTGPAPMLMKAADWIKVRLGPPAQSPLDAAPVLAAACSCFSHLRYAGAWPLPQVTPDWEKFTAKIEADEALKQELGWVGVPLPGRLRRLARPMQRWRGAASLRQQPRGSWCLLSLHERHTSYYRFLLAHILLLPMA